MKDQRSESRCQRSEGSTPLLAAFDALNFQSPSPLPTGFPAGASTVVKSASPIPSAATAPAAEAIYSSADHSSATTPTSAVQSLALRDLVMRALADMAIAQSRAEFITARALLAGVVATLEILLTPEAFTAALREWDINADTLAELRALAGTDNNDGSIEA